MNPAKTIYLFDIDGVLVEPLGYKASFRATLGFFIQKMGLDLSLNADDDIYPYYEANRVTSEWDMVPLSLIALLDTLQAINPSLIFPAELSHLTNIQFNDIPQNVDYRSPINRLAPFLHPGEYPAETALRILHTSPSSPNEPSEGISSSLDLSRSSAPHTAAALFPYLTNHPLSRQILSHTRDIARSYTTRIFQHFSLGSQAFQQTYSLPCEFESMSLLALYDRPFLDIETRQSLLAMREQNRLSIAAYTMRPSLPPREVDGNSIGYAPEAEAALRLVGLEQLPLIGFGRIHYLAERNMGKAETYLKPSPVQALAAIFAALINQELPALDLALSLYSSPGSSALDGLVDKYELFAHPGVPWHIHVFEDSPGGIEAVQRAGAILNQAGLPNQVFAWGITDHPEKAGALRKMGVQTFPDIRIALHQALKRLQ